MTIAPSSSTTLTPTNWRRDAIALAAGLIAVGVALWILSYFGANFILNPVYVQQCPPQNSTCLSQELDGIQLRFYTINGLFNGTAIVSMICGVAFLWFRIVRRKRN